MSLARVVNKISNDSSFAAQWQNDPQAALAGNGFKLSREEVAFLSKALGRADHEEGRRFRFTDLDIVERSWRE